ncbi:hypothetical protein CCAX7_43270 [Capsulimonas corticalis]|uniref:Uncharacterized protein n=1 Tax=Capsulimonas corticalis TaxID=2219043 RepID=A0A402CXH9_9BACT|nr:FHA domain-containing protein [Capsulimonas corticalis]BDI32276.1 hypothetical protein CCAX7_43270 [Capsulimonas corticalis]
MGWKIRKDKPGADEATDEPDGQNPDAEATSPQLPDDSSDTEVSKQRPAFVLDLDNDAFRTDSRHTSLDTSSFGWTPTASPTNDGYQSPSFADSEPSAPSLRDQARAIREETQGLTAEILSLQNKFPTPTTPAAPQVNAQDFDLTSYLQNMQPDEPETPIEMGTSMDPSYPAAPEVDERHIYSPNTYSQPTQPSASYKEPEPSYEAPTRTPSAGGFGAPASEFSIPKVSPFIVKVDAPQPEVEQQKHSLVMKLRNLSATFPLDKEITTIGRPDSDTQNYPDIEIDLDDGVSRKHAEVRQRGNEFFLVDVGSTNGTILNGEQVREFQEIPLTHGDRIRVGERTEIVFE